MRLFLHVLVLLSGVVSLGAELGASRLLAPYFGTSLVVWSSLIGLILVALAVGYWLGGKWADRSPKWESLLSVELGAGTMLALLPLVAAPVLERALLDLGHLQIGMLLGTFAGVLVLLGAPMVLMGCITPFAIKLATTQMDEAGRVAGRLFALSTIGSFLGAFLPTVFLIPLMGTRWTFTTFALVLLTLALVGYLLRSNWKMAGVTLLSIVLAVGIGLFMSSRPIKPGQGVVFEKESPYQYLRVVERPNGWFWLHLNEGLVVHSKYHPEKKLSYGEWDYVALSPFMGTAKSDPSTKARSWAVIGAGAGTTARLVTYFWGEDSWIHGVELDPDVVDVGKRFFGADLPNYQVDVNDGRAWLKTNSNSYDVVSIDAYRQPYIPFELTTVEFFQEVMDHLNEDGVAVINVSRPPKDMRLVNALATTMAQVFPSVHLMHLPDTSMVTLIFGTKAETTLDDYRANLAKADRRFAPLLRKIRDRVGDHYDRSIVLTDDHAPVERLMDLMLVAQALDGHWLE